MTTSHVSRPRRLAAAIVTAVAVGVALAPDASDASARTDAAVVADEATTALGALEQWEATHRPVHYVRFVRARDAVAASLAAELELPLDTFTAEWAGLDEQRQVALFSALSQLGVPYRYRASKPGVAFDCSGLLLYAFDQAGIELPRVSRDQIRAGEPVERDDAVAGDLAYYPGHIAMYIGAGMIVHAPNSGSTVEVAPMSSRSRRFSDVVVLDDVPAVTPDLPRDQL